MKKVCVIGLGYIGLPTAAMFAMNQMQVVGVDVNLQVLEIIHNGGIHIKEAGLETMVQQAIRDGNLVVSDHPEMADAFIIAVPTPFIESAGDDVSSKVGLEQDYKRADMQFVRDATESILPYLRAGNLVILESTSPPLTTEELVRPILERSGLAAGKDFYLAYSPERVLPGQILKELVENARVIGGVNQASAEAGRALYATFVRGEIVLADSTTAEMVKLMENTYRDVNIALANEFSRLASRLGVDIWDAIRIANLHPRVKILNPGPGVGGHCISVDPWFLVEAAPDITRLIYTARMVNDAQPSYVLDLVRAATGELRGKKIAALGLAYKPDVDDLRESPAVEIVRLLQKAGADVRTFEPFKMDCIIPGVQNAYSLEQAIKDADVILLLVRHSQFVGLVPEQVASVSTARLLIDLVNGWDVRRWQQAGFKPVRLGAAK